MPVVRPTLVASDLVLADEIQAAVEEVACSCVHRCTFSDCRHHVIWHRPGLLILVVAKPGVFIRRHGAVKRKGILARSVTRPPSPPARGDP